MKKTLITTALILATPFVSANNNTDFYTNVDEECGIENADVRAEIFTDRGGNAGKATAVNNSRDVTEIKIDIEYELDGKRSDFLDSDDQPLFEVEITSAENGGETYYSLTDLTDDKIEFDMDRLKTDTDFFVKVSSKDGKNLMAGEHIVNFSYTAKCNRK